MNIFLVVIPAFIVMMTAYLLLDKFFQNEDRKRKMEIGLKNQSTLTPIRLRAYERLALLLERTSPNALLAHTMKPDISAQELHAQLIKNIRQEFEHNLSQQIYVSDELWDAITTTQENLIKIINGCAGRMQGKSATELAEVIIRIYAEPGDTPTDVAMQILKQEMRTQFIKA
jgi:hypothetical protein